MTNQEPARYTMFELPPSQLDQTLYNEVGSGLGYTAFLVIRTYDEAERSEETLSSCMDRAGPARRDHSGR